MSVPEATLAAAPQRPQGRHKRLVGLIGAGIQRSLTPALHEAEARAQGLALHYQLIDLEVAGLGVEALPGLLTAARQMGFAGLNITFPCKQAVLPLMDALSDEARAIGAVNTVVFPGGPAGPAVGHNTDAVGWRWGLQRALPGLAAPQLERVVLLGAGGAGAAIAEAALGMGVAQLVLVDTDPSRAAAAAARLSAAHPHRRVDHAENAAEALRGATGLIHATPTGMDKRPGLPLDPGLLHAGLWVSEIVYFPLQTALLAAARAAGCRVCDGGTMAVGQAVGAFRLFTGLQPDAARMEASFHQLVAATGG